MYNVKYIVKYLTPLSLICFLKPIENFNLFPLEFQPIATRSWSILLIKIFITLLFYLSFV